MGFDPIMMAKINAMQKNGGMGRTEKTVLTYDGNDYGKDFVLMNSGFFVRIADVIDPTTIKEVTGVSDGTEMTISADTLNVEKSIHDNGSVIYGVYYDEILFIVILSESIGEGMSAGTYVLSMPNKQMYVSRIECETIHPIDPKFIPGAVLPVVELETVLKEDGTGVALSESDCSVMNEVSATGMPFVLKCLTDDDGFLCGVMSAYGPAELGAGMMYRFASCAGNVDMENSNGAGAWYAALTSAS